jgi:capsular polysaccharide biosynthesis protein
MATLTQITASDAVLTEAFSALNVDPELSGSYTVKSIVVPEANVMETIVTGPSPQLAAALASTIGEIGGARFVDLYRIYDVQVLDGATIPTAPSNTGLSQMLVLAVALGLTAGAGAALLRSAWSERSKQTMRNRLGAYDPAVTSIEEHNRFQRTG